MVVAEGGRVIALPKKMPPRYDHAGAGVGFLKVRHEETPHVVASLRTFVDREAWHMEYEDALIGLFSDVKVGYEVIGGLPWIEIDFPEDIEKAERDILPKL